MTRSQSKRLRLLYWVVTPLFLLGQGWAALQCLLEAPSMTQTIVDLGYAFASHLGAGDSFKAALVPAAFFVVQLASFLIWKRLAQRSASRRRRYLFEPSSRDLELQT